MNQFSSEDEDDEELDELEEEVTMELLNKVVDELVEPSDEVAVEVAEVPVALPSVVVMDSFDPVDEEVDVAVLVTDEFSLASDVAAFEVLDDVVVAAEL